MRLLPLPGLLLAGLGASAAIFGTHDNAPLPLQHPIVIGSPSRPPQHTESASPYRDALLDLHKSLVDISSTSGAEGDVGEWLLSYLETHNYTTRKQAVQSLDNTPPTGRFNVIAWPKSADRATDYQLVPNRLPPILVTSHIDVVPPHIPYDIDDGPITRKTVIRGRGSVDAKGSVAAQITALEELRKTADGGALTQANGAPAVMLLFVVGEEDRGDGMKTFSAEYVNGRPSSEAHRGFDSVIFGEPTENKLACGHKGMLSCAISSKGKAGHSGYPWLGKSANEVLVRGLVAMLDADLGATERFGNTTVNVGLLRGGVARNVIPAAAEAEVAVRVAMGPQATGHEVVRERMQAALQSVDAEALSLTCGQGYGAIDCRCEGNGLEGFDTITVNYGTDVANLAGDHTRYLYGPGDILVAHSDHEALTVGDLETAVDGYKTLIQHALKESGVIA